MQMYRSKHTSTTRFSWGLLGMIVGLLVVQPSAAQAPRRVVQAGLGVIPGVGVQAGYITPRSIFSMEALLYVDTTPQFAGGEGSVQVSTGVGGAIRVSGFARTFGNTNPRYDIDIGLRFGPSLFFVTNATREEKNQQFSLFLEPFVRFSIQPENKPILFIEVGSQRSHLRAGLWFDV